MAKFANASAVLLLLVCMASVAQGECKQEGRHGMAQMEPPIPPG